jgi:hypothetical protein
MMLRRNSSPSARLSNYRRTEAIFVEQTVNTVLVTNGSFAAPCSTGKTFWIPV